MSSIVLDIKTVRTHVAMPQTLVSEVDQLVGNRHRSDFVAAAVAEKVRREKLGRTLVTTAGMLASADHPELGYAGTHFGVGAPAPESG